MMSTFQSLRVKSTFSDDIVSMGYAETQYVDNEYFRKSFKAFIQNPGELIQIDDERRHWNSYPVKTVAVEVGWILNEPEGFDFL